MKESTVSLKVDEKTYQEIKDHYSSYVIKEGKDYIDYVASFNDVIITGYLSNKAKKTIIFKGEKALEEARLFDANASLNEEIIKDDEKKSWIDIEEQIGSDEVGVGDFFLPMIVVAAYVKPSQIKKLKELGVTDSKKISDKKIREIGPELIKGFKYSKLTLTNDKYNEMIAKGENINSLKAKMHNRALANIHKDYLDIQRIYVDQFVNADKFYSYLTSDDEPIVRGIAFKTKGESWFPSVALASVIARYAFLLEKDKLDEKYGVDFPFGSSSKVDVFAQELAKKLPKEEFDSLVKINFKNYKKIAF